MPDEWAWARDSHGSRYGFTATLDTAGDQTITALDTVNSSITGMSNAISVSLPASALAAALVSASTGVGPGTALADKAAAIQTAVNAPDKATACADITNFLGLVKAQTGKKLSPTNVTTLTMDANNLAAALGGC